MNKIIFSFCIALFWLTCSAQVTDYIIDVEDFSKLVVVDDLRVEYIQSTDSAGKAVFRCAPEIAPNIMFSNRNKELRIQSAADENTLTGMPLIRVYSKSLKFIENSGDSLVTTRTMAPVNKLTVRQIGNGSMDINGIHTDKLTAGVTAGSGTIILHGITEDATYKNIGTGVIEAQDVMAVDVKCKMLGPGPVYCHPSGKLKIIGAGSCRVVYFHTPTKIINRAIGVKCESGVME